MGPNIEIGHRTTGGNVVHISTVPQFGLGVFKMRGMECTKACLQALEAGYRHIDTARAYENEKEVGNALRQSGIPREEIFVTTKLRRGHATGKKDAQNRCQESLEYLGLDYIDLYLIHAPPRVPLHRETSWMGMQDCLDNGWARAIGVSNYGAHHLDMMYSYADLMPAVNQIEIHLWLQRRALRAATQAVGAVPIAYSPIAHGLKNSDKRLLAIASRIGCTPSQVAIKWCIDSGCITIPKSSDIHHISENIESLQVDISSELLNIQKLDEYYISCRWDPTSES